MDITTIIWLKNLKYAAEIFYLISGPVVAYFAYRALEQISVSKNSTRTQSTRESYRLAAERCEFFNDRIMPLRKKLKEACKIHSILYFDKSEVSFNNDEISVKPYDVENEGRKLLLINDEINDVGNGLELFAVYFTSKIADESLAFRTIGKLYCEVVKELLPVLVPLSTSEQVEHVIQLF